jgi:hypothetical protein
MIDEPSTPQGYEWLIKDELAARLGIGPGVAQRRALQARWTRQRGPGVMRWAVPLLVLADRTPSPDGLLGRLEGVEASVAELREQFDHIGERLVLLCADIRDNLETSRRAALWRAKPRTP